ncbi:MAG TPA: M64 family metallopeptidase [Vicinamibacterales bacterium]|nr:M64 family metallopeptidase [Vicinamibacterales bacterium]
MLLWLTTLLAGTLLAQASATSPFAFDRTMRVDYFHTGGPRSGETIALDRVVNDGPWPGSRTQLVDPTGLGPYRFDVRERAGGRLIYSRGFASVYGEWETTAEARAVHRTFHESLRFPWPAGPVQVAVSRRQADNRFVPIWSVDVDPASRFVNGAPPGPVGNVWPIFENGPPAENVDLLVIGEGYTRAELSKFHADAKRLVETLFAEEPFKSRRSDFNVRALDLPSAVSGVNRPNAGVFRRTPLSTEYNIFDSERYMLTLDNRALRDAASAAPYEFVEILVNERTYGGGGIFNDHATSSADSAFSPYVFVHEFAHHFAALADEYYTSDVAYETGTVRKYEPWEPNVTALLDPAALKWRDLVTPGTPLPTPWEKEAFERQSRAIQERRREIRKRNAAEEEMDALFREQREAELKLLGGMKHSGAVGAFEGASYEARGLYRPQADCIMFTRNPVGFCRVCRRAIERIIDLYSR